MIEVGDGRVAVALVELDQSAVDKGRDQLRIELDGLVVVGDGEIVVLLVPVDVAALGIDRRKVRREYDRLRIIGKGALVVLLRLEGVAEGTERVRAAAVVFMDCPPCSLKYRPPRKNSFLELSVASWS